MAESGHTVAVHDFEVLVLGSGPGGQKAALAAAKLGRGVAIVERRNMMGGVCVNPGTSTSKTLREAVLHLTGLNQRELYGPGCRVKEDITGADLAARTQRVIGREIDVIRSRPSRNHVTVLGIVLSLVGTCRSRGLGRIVGQPLDGFVGREAWTDV